MKGKQQIFSSNTIHWATPELIYDQMMVGVLMQKVTLDVLIA